MQANSLNYDRISFLSKLSLQCKMYVFFFFFVKGVMKTALDVLNHFQSCSKRSPPIPNRQFFCNRMYFYLTLCVPSFSLSCSLYLSLVLSYITLEVQQKAATTNIAVVSGPSGGQPSVCVRPTVVSPSMEVRDAVCCGPHPQLDPFSRRT